MYPLGTWFVSGLRVWILCIKETMMMMIIIIIIIIIPRTRLLTLGDRMNFLPLKSLIPPTVWVGEDFPADGC